MARAGEALVFIYLFQAIWTKCIEKDVSDACRIYGICEHVDDYPTELARKLIAELKSQGVIFDKEEQASPEMSIMNRFGDDKTPLCAFDTVTKSPKRALDEFNKLQNILNDDENVTYSFNLQICRGKEPVTCSSAAPTGESLFVMGYTCECVQTYKLQQLYFIDETNNIKLGNFKIPVSCGCGLKYDDKKKL